MQIEEVVRVSSKGQIVLPKSIRDKLDIQAGKKLLVATNEEGKILLTKLEDLSIEEISGRTTKVIEKEGIDVAALVDEAISWARRKN